VCNNSDDRLALFAFVVQSRDRTATNARDDHSPTSTAELRHQRPHRTLGHRVSAGSPTMARSINDGTSTQQTNMPKERHTGGKSRQDITETTRGFLLCVACDDEPPLDDLWKAPCQHAYCTECIEQLFRLSMDDETLYPPKCCQQIIPWSDVEAFVSQELATAFKGKREELVTQDKTYCSDPTCSTFIGSSHIAADTSTATCPTCKKLTCAMCKAASHAKECQADPSLQATLEVAKGNGWQRCQECGRVIDRTGGCNHIS